MPQLSRGQWGRPEALQQLCRAVAAGALTARFEAGLALPIDVAQMHAAAGDSVKATEWIEWGFDTRDPNMPYVGVWPLFDPIRDEPRFQRRCCVK